jgi:hypothetical protein
MQKDTDYQELQFLQQEYRRKTGRERARVPTASNNGFPSEPPPDFDALVNSRFPRPRFDPERRRVLEMMKR